MIIIFTQDPLLSTKTDIVYIFINKSITDGKQVSLKHEAFSEKYQETQ